MRQQALFVLAAAAIAVMAPDQVDAKTRLGVRAGMARAKQTYDWYHWDVDFETARRSGLAFGLTAELSSVPYFAFRADVSYLQKGRPGGYRIDYLSLVAAARVSTNSDQFRVYFFGGPRLDIKLGMKTELFDWSSDFYTGSHKPVVSGLTGGAGVEIKTGARASWLLEFRYDYDLDLAAEYKTWRSDEEGRLTEETSVAIKNNSFFVLTGVMF